MIKLDRKLTKQELDEVNYIAGKYFVDDSPGDLDAQQFRAKCIVNAVCMVLNIQGVEFPQDRIVESIND